MRLTGKKLAAIGGAAVMTLAVVAGPVSGWGTSTRSTTIGTICTATGKSSSTSYGSASTKETTSTSCTVGVNPYVQFNSGGPVLYGWVTSGTLASVGGAPNMVLTGTTWHKLNGSAMSIMWQT